MRKFNEDKQAREEANERSDDLVAMIGKAMEAPELRAIAIYGDINEDRCAEAIYGLLALDSTSKKFDISPDDSAAEELIEVVEPIDFYISRNMIS